jgi:hypothetical protein
MNGGTGKLVMLLLTSYQLRWYEYKLGKLEKRFSSFGVRASLYKQYNQKFAKVSFHYLQIL